MIKSAQEKDKLRLQDGQGKTKLKRKKEQSSKVSSMRKIKRTTIDTIPYERILSDYIILLKSNIKIGTLETANLYSKSFLIPDFNYTSLPEEEQEQKLISYMDLLNGFDTTASLQISMCNVKINKKEFEESILMRRRNNKFDKDREEFNDIIRERLMQGQNGIHCKKYITVSVLAVDFNTASTKILNYEAYMNSCAQRLGTELIPLKANDRIRLLTDIFRGVNEYMPKIIRDEIAAGTEKRHCCPDYFEFKNDYFMFNEKYARCLIFQEIPSVMIPDTILKEITETNQTLIITKNINFIKREEAIKEIRKKQTGYREEAMQKAKAAAAVSKGFIIDPIEGTELEEQIFQAKEMMEDLQRRNQKMMYCQIIIMIISDDFGELNKNTQSIEILLNKYQIKSNRLVYQQEKALSSVLPIGNSHLENKQSYIKVDRKLTSESTAVFCPFNSVKLIHPGGVYYGVNKITRDVIMLNRQMLNNANCFIFGLSGSGKGMMAKAEIKYKFLAFDDEIIIIDPEGEYTALAEQCDGEVIYISENSSTNINPLDLTPNPDPSDTSYDPITAKLEFLLSFFAAILGVNTIDPLQLRVIDTVMRLTYKNNLNEPTLVEYFFELEKFEKENTGEIALKANYLKESLYTYVRGSIDVFSKKSNVDINKRFVVYNIKDLGKNLQTLGMMLVLENVWSRIAKNRVRNVGTSIYIDEFYLMFKSEQNANFFFELYKRARKWGGEPTGITQNVGDLLMSEKAQAMLANTKFVIMLEQSPADAEKLANILKIPQETMSYVINSGIGQGLLYTGKYGNVPFDNRIPTNTHLYRTISTKFGEENGEET